MEVSAFHTLFASQQESFFVSQSYVSIVIPVLVVVPNTHHSKARREKTYTLYEVRTLYSSMSSTDTRAHVR